MTGTATKTLETTIQNLFGIHFIILRSSIDRENISLAASEQNLRRSIPEKKKYFSLL